MTVLLHNEFSLATDPPSAWRLLLDVPRIAGCMPGAELLAVVDEKTYRGRTRVKVGPVQLAFNGEASWLEVDDERRRAVMRLKGNDEKGRGAAHADVSFEVVAATRAHDGLASGGCTVKVDMDLKLSGSVAQYGRASGLIEGIAGQFVAEFAANLNKLTAQQQPGGPAASMTAAPPMSAFRVLWGAFKQWAAGWFGAARQGARK